MGQIWYRGRLPSAYFDFNVYFFKIFVIHIFSLGKFGPTKSDVCQIKWNLVQGYIVYAYFDFNIYFFKILFMHVFSGKFGPEMWSSSTSLNAYFDFTVYFFKFFFLRIRSGNLVPKPEVFQIDWNVFFWCFIFQNFTHSYFWANLVP